MNYILRSTIEKPVGTIMFFLLLVLLGILSLSKIEINLLPKMDFPKLTVITILPNASIEEVDNLLTRPINEAIGNTSGLKKVSSESFEEKSIIKLQFAWGVKADFAAMEIREKLDSIRKNLPEDASRPLVMKFDPSQKEIIEAVVFPKKMSEPKNLRNFIQNEFKHFIERVDGVAKVKLIGGSKKEILVELDKFKMNSSNLSFFEIENSIRSTNLNTPVGHIENGSKNILIRTIGEYDTITKIGETLIKSDNKNKSIKLSTIAKINESYEDQKGLANYNGKECVIISIYKESGKNSNEISENVKIEFEKLSSKFHDMVEIKTIYDEAEYIQNSISNISGELVLGTILAFLAIYIFLGNFQNSLIILTVVPISVFSTFLFLYIKNVSLNVMSLGGISLGIGMLFDSGNVVLTSIDNYKKKGIGAKKAALLGATDVASSISSAVLTTIIVFLPILFIKGAAGIIFGEMAYAVTISLSISLLCSLTLIPSLASLSNIPRKSETNIKRIVNIFSKLENKILSKYIFFLDLIFIKQKIFFLIVFILFSISMIFLFFLDKEFTPKTDRKEFLIKITTPHSSNLKLTSEIVQYIETNLLKDKYIQHILSKVGADENSENDFLSNNKSNTAEIKVFLYKTKSVRTKDIIDFYKYKLKFREGIQIEYIETGEIISSVMESLSKNSLIELKGNNLDIMESYSEEIKSEILKIAEIEKCISSLEKNSEELRVIFDEIKFSYSNLDHENISMQLKGLIKGEIVSRIRLNGQDKNIRLRYENGERNSINKLENIYLKSPNGNQLTLSSIASIVPAFTNHSIQKTNNVKIGILQPFFSDTNRKEVLKKIQAILELKKPPAGIEIIFNKQNEDIDHSLKELKVSFFLSIIFIYMLLASQFESFLYPILMLGTIPLIFIGVSPALFFFDKSLNISSIMGIILLVGIVVDNAALFYEYLEKFELENATLLEAVKNSSITVFKPILLNNLTTIFGLIPAVYELGEGTDFQSPMAISVTFGLFSSVIISLFLIPILFFNLKKKYKT